MKKLFLFLFVAAAGFAQATNGTLTAFTPVGVTAPGTSGVVSIILAPGTVAPAAVEFTLVVPPGEFSNLASAAGAASTAAAKQLSCSPWSATSATNTITCVVFGLNQTNLGAGSIADFTLTVNPAVPNSSYVLTPSNVSAADVKGNAVTLSPVAGTFLIKNACDLNGDGAINLQDVLVAVQNAIAAKTCGPQTCNAGDIELEILVALGQLACPVTGP